MPRPGRRKQDCWHQCPDTNVNVFATNQETAPQWSQWLLHDSGLFYWRARKLRYDQVWPVETSRNRIAPDGDGKWWHYEFLSIREALLGFPADTRQQDYRTMQAQPPIPAYRPPPPPMNRANENFQQGLRQPDSIEEPDEEDSVFDMPRLITQGGMIPEERRLGGREVVSEKKRVTWPESLEQGDELSRHRRRRKEKRMPKVDRWLKAIEC